MRVNIRGSFRRNPKAKRFHKLANSTSQGINSLYRCTEKTGFASQKRTRGDKKVWQGGSCKAAKNAQHRLQKAKKTRRSVLFRPDSHLEDRARFRGFKPSYPTLKTTLAEIGAKTVKCASINRKLASTALLAGELHPGCLQSNELFPSRSLDHIQGDGDNTRTVSAGRPVGYCDRERLDQFRGDEVPLTVFFIPPGFFFGTTIIS